ncbi:MAG TPA: YdeI/OmpD-associated family protein [Candidatus Saccharimonadales bacterium]|nr:YdeI/OmpD-associated family protein [Candidatus Saccharimonadales bacterium]
MMSSANNKPTDYPILFFEDQKGWEDWLSQNHATQNGAWLKFAKKGTGVKSTNHAETLDVALCYGWIDGQAKSIDETYYLQKYTPRRAKSIWSKINIGKVEKLIAEGKMQPAGQAEIDRAKADGRWEQAYHSPANMTVPEDFQKALDTDPTAKEFFGSLSKTNTYAFLWRIATAKKPETRARRIEKFIDMLHKGEKLH